MGFVLMAVAWTEKICPVSSSVLKRSCSECSSCCADGFENEVCSVKKIPKQTKKPANKLTQKYCWIILNVALKVLMVGGDNAKNMKAGRKSLIQHEIHGHKTKAGPSSNHFCNTHL